MICEYIETCPFFQGVDSQAIRALKDVYCDNNPSICARKQVAMAIGRENVPDKLSPNHTHLVQGLIDNSHKNI